MKGPIKCLSSQSFWLLLFINGVGTGCGLTLLNNLGQQVCLLLFAAALHICLYNDRQ